MPSYYRYKPRSVRKLEVKTRRKLLYTLGIIIILAFAMFQWGLPILVNSVQFLQKEKPQTNGSAAENPSLPPPVLNIPYEATNTAIIAVSGYSSPDAKVELYIDDALVDSSQTSPDGSFYFPSVTLNPGRNFIYGKTLDSKGGPSRPSKGIRLDFSDDKPSLELSSPDDNKEIQGGDRKVRISGKTSTDNNISINGSFVLLNGDGTFAIDKDLGEGDNIFTISATNNYGSVTTITRKVTYKP